MTLDTSGFLLEGVRVAAGNSPFTYPPRSVVSDQPALDASAGRADYMLSVAGQGAGSDGIEIADPGLRVVWTRNDSITRFDYDSFARRWSPMPGGPPEALGRLSNSPRLHAPVPVDGGPPYSLYLGPGRSVVFTVSKVGSESAFADPPAGTVQIASDTGALNFGTADTSNPVYASGTVTLCRQSFFDRTLATGQVGLADGSDVFLNPVPADGQVPLVRVGLGRHLVMAQVATESLLYDPPSGHGVFSVDTGAVRVSSSDAASRLGSPVYYDGVLLGSASLVRGTVGTASPSPGVLPGSGSLGDAERWVFFYDSPQGRHYLRTTYGSPQPGYVAVNQTTRSVSMDPSDSASAAGASLQYVDSLVHVERGVSVQLYRSAVNSSGLAQEPDFVEVYAVSGQVVQDGLARSPMVPLTAVPVDDASLTVAVAQGSGTYAGPLPHARSAADGPCHLIDPATRSVRFGLRRSESFVLQDRSAFVKLSGAAVFPDGLSVSKDGSAVTPGVDFDFDADTGSIEFMQPVGGSDPSNREGVGGSVTGPRTFIASGQTFTPSDIGRQLLVRSGPNSGFRKIVEVVGSREVSVLEPFAELRAETVDVLAGKDVLVDNMWAPLTHEMLKLRLEVLTSPTDPVPVLVPQSGYTVIPGSGQVNLGTPAVPGQVFRISYSYLESSDEGVSVTSVARQEFAGFKVRQEVASSTRGSPIVTFNPSGATVLEDRGITVSLDGVTADPAMFRFSAPGTLLVGSGVDADEVVVDYWIAESPGGNTTFKVTKSPMDVDYPAIVGLDASSDPVTTFNGDLTASLPRGAAVLVESKDLLLVGSSSYAGGVTSVRFTTPPATTRTGVPLQVSGPVADVMAPEPASVETVPRGTSSVTVNGVGPYARGTVLTLDGDPYLVIASSSSGGRTAVTLSATASRNYITPAVARSSRPVLEPGSSYATSLPVHPGYPVTVVKYGASASVLARGPDYTVGDGGQVVLSVPLVPGDRLEAAYMGRLAQPAGTRLDVGYAHAVVPDESNGMAGQKLVLGYSLYSPDTFFYRVETVESFIPEVVQSMQQSAATGFGPNTASRSGLRPKDMGVKGLWFDEQHELNVDVVIGRLLKFYNDLVNGYEDVLASYDGRVVGGTSGRFRYDGLRDNPPRESYQEITNDIDDRVKLYDEVVLSGFYTFTSSPVYAYVSDPCPLSRLFPTSRSLTVALNGDVGFVNFGKPIGSLGVQNVSSVGQMSPSLSAARFSQVAGALVSLDSNGGTSPPSKPLVDGAPVVVYSEDGRVLALSAVSSVSQASGSWTAVLGFEPPEPRGSVVLNLSVGDPKIYSPGRDLSVDAQTGLIRNSSLPSSLASAQVAVDGNELVDTVVSFPNQATSPYRFPALDGSALDDSGVPGRPLLSYASEAAALEDELPMLSILSSGSVLVDRLTVEHPVGFMAGTVYAGSVISFLEGPNADQRHTVSAVLSPTQFQVSAQFTYADATVRAFTPVIGGRTAGTAALAAARAIDGAAAAPAAAGALIGSIGSRVGSIGQVVQSLGSQVFSGSVSVSGKTVTASVDLAALGVRAGDILYLPGSASAGVYRIASLGTTTATVSDGPPWGPFPSAVTTDAVIVSPWSFVGRDQFGALSACLRTSVQFYQETVSWASSFNQAGVPARKARVRERLDEIAASTASVESVLRDSEKLYDTRFLWIQQRTDKRDGTVTRYKRAAADRVDAAQRLAADQQKLYIMQRLV